MKQLSQNKKDIWVGLIVTLLSYLAIQTIFILRKLSMLTSFFGDRFYENQFAYLTTSSPFSFSSSLNIFFDYGFVQAKIITILQHIMSNETIVTVLFLLSTTLAYYLLCVNKQTDGRKIFTLLFCIFSPAIIMTFFSFSSGLMGIPGLLLFYLVLQKKRKTISAFLFLFLSLFSFETAMFALIILFYFQHKQKRSFFIMAQVIASVVFFVFHWNSILLPLRFAFPFFEAKVLSGYSIYLFCVGTIGFILTWTKKKKLLHLISLLIILLSFFNPQFIPYAAAYLAVYGSFCIERLFEHDWQETVLKIASLLLIYGLLVGGFVFFAQASLFGNPGIGESDFYEQTAQRLLPHEDVETTILVLPRQQPYVSYFTQATTVIADNLSFYQSTDLQESLIYLQNLGVEYLIVDQQMRDGEIWLLDNEGLLLLLTDENVFKKIVETEYGTIYWVSYSSLLQ